MKKLNVLAVTAMIFLGTVSVSCGLSTPSAKLKTDVDSMSYAIGIANGSGFRENLKSIPGGECNVDDLIAGFVQAIKEDTTAMKMTPVEAQAYMQTYFSQASEKEAKKNKEAGEKFLEENKTKEGVQVTESGLQYKVITEGTGAKPTAESQVQVNYIGTLIDGTEFDSSIKRGQPAEFGVGQVIRGWSEGLQMMSVGSKYMFYIPSELAYGEMQASELLKPNSTLIFEVELLEIISAEAQK